MPVARRQITRKGNRGGSETQSTSSEIPELDPQNSLESIYLAGFTRNWTSLYNVIYVAFRASVRIVCVCVCMRVFGGVYA